MALINNQSSNVMYLSMSMGKLRKKVTPDNPNAVKRISEKTKKEFYELIWDAVSGYVKGLEYRESKDYGNSLVLTLKDSDYTYYIQISEESSYFIDFLNKLPNIALDKELIISPYDYLPQGQTKRKKGVTLKQDGNKINSAYTTYNEATKKFTYKDGFPEPQDCKDKDDWEIYFKQVKKFLKNKLKQQISDIEQFKVETNSGLNSAVTSEFDGIHVEDDSNTGLPF